MHPAGTLCMISTLVLNRQSLLVLTLHHPATLGLSEAKSVRHFLKDAIDTEADESVRSIRW